MNKLNKSFLIEILLAGSVLFFSALAYIKLGDLGDGDPIRTPLRIITLNVGVLAYVIIRLIFKLKDK